MDFLESGIMPGEDNMDVKYGERAQRAVDYFKSGLNCAQAVFLVYAEDFGMDKETALAVSSSFGGGMGRLREVCGAVSGVFMAAGMRFGTYPAGDAAAKKRHYAIIQELAGRFEAAHGSIVCRELLGLKQKRQQPEPEKRTDEYYKKRPCPELIRDTVEIYDRFLEEYERGEIKF